MMQYHEEDSPSEWPGLALQSDASRLVALELAIDQTRGLGVQASTVVETARTFLAFLKGEA